MIVSIIWLIFNGYYNGYDKEYFSPLMDITETFAPSTTQNTFPRLSCTQYLSEGVSLDV